MANSKLPTFHIDQQYAIGLLGPIENVLEDLTARLDQYAGRMPVTDADRVAIVQAGVAVAQAKETLHSIISSRRNESKGLRE